MRMRFGQRLLEGEEGKAGYIFTVMVLFVPTSSFYVYYAALIAGLFFLVWSSKGKFPWRVESFYIYAACISLLLLLCVYRWAYFSNAEDFKELLKLVVFFTVIFFGVRLRLRNLEVVFAVFVVVNTVVSLLQYLGWYGYGVREITEIYNAKHHVEASLSYSAPRALGLSPGPGQQSVIGLFFFSYFLVLFFFGGGGGKRLLFCLVALIGIVLSQSKTALISIALGSGAILLLFVVHAGYRSKLGVLLFFFVVLTGVIVLKDQLLLLFPEYFRLAAQGGDVSSLQSRLGNWVQMLDVFLVEDSMFFYLFGIGRSGLESYHLNDLPYDSDYIYLLINYGLVGLVSFVVVVGCFLFRGVLFFSREDFLGKFLVVSIIYAIISAVALNYFFEPRILILFAIVVFNYLARPVSAAV